MSVQNWAYKADAGKLLKTPHYQIYTTENTEDVQRSVAQVMEGAMSATTTLQVPEDQVAALMKQIADEGGLDMQAALPNVVAPSSVASVQEDALTKRCAREI